MKKIVLLLALVAFSATAQERYSVSIADFNSKSSDFASAYTEKGLIFSSERDSSSVANRKQIINGEEHNFLNLYSKSNDGNSVSRLKGVFSGKYHESTVTQTKNGNVMYFTRNAKSTVTGVHILKLYKVEKLNNKWTNLTELPFNGETFSTANPALSTDETKLYFASDREGSLGKSDLYVVDIKEDGTFSEPLNLGDKINTAGVDSFPYMDAYGDLYFASSGRGGNGGLDVFVSPINEDYTTVYNLGAPLNTAFDDFAMIFDFDKKTGYISTNRENGVGSDDIYKFTELEPLYVPAKGEIAGVITNTKDEPLGEVVVTLFNEENQEIAQVLTNADGSYKFENVDFANKTYNVTSAKEQFENSKQEFIAKRDNRKGVLNIKLEPIPFEEDGRLVNLDPIYFEFDKAVVKPESTLVLDKVVAYMNKFSDVKINVESHTDSKANDAYNLRLSEKRAQATVNYIVNKGGIDASRITGKGFGETRLLNKCKNNVPCTKAEQQVNRRSEFIIVK